MPSLNWLATRLKLNFVARKGSDDLVRGRKKLVVTWISQWLLIIVPVGKAVESDYVHMGNIEL